MGAAAPSQAESTLSASSTPYSASQGSAADRGSLARIWGASLPLDESSRPPRGALELEADVDAETTGWPSLIGPSSRPAASQATACRRLCALELSEVSPPALPGTQPRPGADRESPPPRARMTSHAELEPPPLSSWQAAWSEKGGLLSRSKQTVTSGEEDEDEDEVNASTSASSLIAPWCGAVIGAQQMPPKRCASMGGAPTKRLVGNHALSASIWSAGALVGTGYSPT